jgi:hypothetical protein
MSIENDFYRLMKTANEMQEVLPEEATSPQKKSYTLEGLKWGVGIGVPTALLAGYGRGARWLTHGMYDKYKSRLLSKGYAESEIDKILPGYLMKQFASSPWRIPEATELMNDWKHMPEPVYMAGGAMAGLGAGNIIGQLRTRAHNKAVEEELAARAQEEQMAADIDDLMEKMAMFYQPPSAIESDFSDLGLSKFAMEKQANILASLAGHIIPNLTMKWAKNSGKGHELLHGQFGAGFELGRKGMEMNPVMFKRLLYGFGPESVAEYLMGLELGRRASKYSDVQQERMLRLAKGKMESFFGANADKAQEKIDIIKKTPMFNTAYDWMDGRIKGAIPEFTQKSMDILMKDAVPAGSRSGKVQSLVDSVKASTPLALLAAADPFIIAQPLISLGRKEMAQSSIGNAVMKGGFNAGIEGNKGVLNFRENPISTNAIDVLGSPAVLDSYKIGKSFAEAAETPEQLAQMQVAGNKMIDKVIEATPRGYVQRLVTGIKNKFKKKESE